MELQSVERGTEVPEATIFGRLVSPHSAKNRCARALHAILSSLDPESDLPTRLDAIERLARWIVAGPPPPVDAEMGDVGTPPPTARLRLLLRALKEVPVWKGTLSRVVQNIVAESSSFRLFCEVGLPNQRGLLAESADRLSRAVLPMPADTRDMGELLSRSLRSEADTKWLNELSRDLVDAITTELDVDWQPVVSCMTDAISVLATRISSLGLSEDIRRRSPERPIRESPFYMIVQTPHEDLHAVLAECRRIVAIVVERLEQFGVSVDVVYRLDVITKYLDRIEALLPFVLASEEDEATRRPNRLLASLAEARRRDRSVRDLFRMNTRLLARKIIERAGQTGEHYITVTRQQYFMMLASAGGGGVLTAGTCVLKFLTKWGHYPLFIDGMFSSINYALSFVAMQLLGFTLATKQPSMTAAALAGSLEDSRDEQRFDALTTTIARICRSQLAAAIGNVFLVIPAALAFDYFYRGVSGHPFLDVETASDTASSFHPLRTGTIFYAALTGVLLWASSLGAGWLENWAVYRRIPEGIAQHRIKRFVGKRTMAAVGNFIARHVSGVGGNVTLGFLLGMTPILGKFVGLPLDVRHITLSTGSLVLAGSSLSTAGTATWQIFVPAVVGIAIIGLLNFGVSFILALGVALRARSVVGVELWRLVKAVVSRFTHRPSEFFFPPKTEG